MPFHRLNADLKPSNPLAERVLSVLHSERSSLACNAIATWTAAIPSLRMRRSRDGSIDRFTHNLSDSLEKHACRGSKIGRFCFQYIVILQCQPKGEQWNSTSIYNCSFLLVSRKKWKMTWILGLFLLKDLFPLNSLSLTWISVRSKMGQTTGLLTQLPNTWHQDMTPTSKSIIK